MKKWTMLLACWVVFGCGVIYGLVHGLVPHLIAPNLFPQAQAHEVRSTPVENAVTSAAEAVRAGAMRPGDVLASR